MLCTADAARLKQMREVEELRAAAGNLQLHRSVPPSVPANISSAAGITPFTTILEAMCIVFLSIKCMLQVFSSVWQALR